MKQRCGFADDVARGSFGKGETHHGGHEHGAIGAFGIAIKVSKLAGKMAGDVRHGRSDGAVDVGAELRTNREPEFVIAGMSGVGCLETFGEIEPSLLAGAPRTARVFLPVL